MAKPVSRASIKATVLALLANQPMSLAELCSASKADKLEIEPILLSLSIEGIVEYVREPFRCYRISESEVDLSFLEVGST